MREHFTPRDVAQAVGVSESTVKRWCDQGLIDSDSTPGGHRRIGSAALVQALRERNFRLMDPSLLGLPPGTGQHTGTLESALPTLTQALIDGDEASCRRTVLDCYLSGEGLAVICDRMIAPAFHRIGELWGKGRAEIYQERRASEITRRLLREMRTYLPRPAEDAPAALGGTPPGDHFALPTAMVEIVLRERGWNAESLGISLPMHSMVMAIRRHRPQLFWVSVSFLREPASFLADYRHFYDAAGRDVSVVVGGRALTEAVRTDMRYAAYCDSLQHLEAFAAALARRNGARFPLSEAG